MNGNPSHRRGVLGRFVGSARCPRQRLCGQARHRRGRSGAPVRPAAAVQGFPAGQDHGRGPCAGERGRGPGCRMAAREPGGRPGRRGQGHHAQGRDDGHRGWHRDRHRRLRAHGFPAWTDSPTSTPCAPWRTAGSWRPNCFRAAGWSSWARGSSGRKSPRPPPSSDWRSPSSNADPVPFSAALGAEMGEVVAGLQETRGVSCSAAPPSTASSATATRVTGLNLTDGRQLPADLVLVGIGAVPNTGWLSFSGLEIKNGVLCDAVGRTNLPGIVAVGDCAAWFDERHGGHRRVEHWTSATEQAELAVEALLGAGSRRPSPEAALLLVRPARGEAAVRRQRRAGGPGGQLRPETRRTTTCWPCTTGATSRWRCWG